MAVSIRDVAQRAGVSVGTVSNVLNHSEKVAPASVERVQEAIDELGYVRNDAARQLRAGRSSTVGLVVLDVRNPFFTDIARGAEDAAAEVGLSVILGNSDEDVAREATYLDLFEEQRVRGVLISPYRDLTERLARMRKRGIPVVLVDRQSDGQFSSVSVDDVAGGRIAARHLIETGRRRIVFAGGALDIRQIADRLEGAQAVIADHADATLEVMATTASQVADGRATGEAIADRAPADRPDAVFAANDLVAIGVLQGLLSRPGIRVPEDIAIIGFDDIDFAAAAVVPISSVRQPRQLIGERALRILVAEADDPTLAPQQVVFEPELVERESTRTR